MPVPILTVSQMREWERATWATGKTEEEVIQTVGRLVAQYATAMTRPRQKILIIAGRGHNGDDARAAQAFLEQREVTLLNVTDPKTALEEFRALTGARSFDLLIDALFGIGLNRPLDEDWKNLIEAINESRSPILAVDVPSGLNAETGEPEGEAVRATVTLTVGAPKMGMLSRRAAEFIGWLAVAPEIGLIPCPQSSELNWTLTDDFQNFPPTRPVTAHKGDFGHLAIFAGSVGYHGAAVLAARGALRAQPGLVTVFPYETVYLPVAAQLQAAMVSPWRLGKPLPRTCSAHLYGPGLAAEDIPEAFKTELLTLWLTSPLPMIVDASSLDWLRPRPVPERFLRVITPHPGEAARMLGVTIEQIQADRPSAVHDLSRRFGNCHVVLKGYQTLIGRNGSEVFVNSSGNPLLAQGGSGDVLAGFLAGLLAQPELQKDPMRTIRYAVWAHGVAADRLSQQTSNWTIEELVEQMGVR